MVPEIPAPTHRYDYKPEQLYACMIDVGDLAVAVDIALGRGLQDQLALISTGLTCVCTNVAALASVGVQNCLLRLTVDEDDGGAGGRDGVHDGLCRSGLDWVFDQTLFIAI